jgi:hypothetical protein
VKQKKSKAKRPAPRKKPPARAAKPPPTKKPVAVKPKTVRKPEDPRVKKFQSALGHALYNRRMLDRAFAELREKMSDTKKKALQALAAAALAVSAAAQVLAEDEETSTPTPAEPAKPETPKAPASKKKTEEKAKPAETPAAEPAKAEEKAKPAAEDGKAIMDKIRDACKEYANVYGRDGLRAVLDKYAPGKTVADIPADKLPEFLKDLGG